MKIYAYIAALILLGGMLGYGVHIYRKAERVDVAEAQAKAANQRAIDTAAGFLKAAQNDQNQQAILVDLRNSMAAQALTFAQALKSQPLTREVAPHVDPKTGVASCHERDPVRYLELFNAAIKGLAPSTP